MIAFMNRETRKATVDGLLRLLVQIRKEAKAQAENHVAFLAEEN